MKKALYPLIKSSIQYRQKNPLLFHYEESFFLTVYQGLAPEPGWRLFVSRLWNILHRLQLRGPRRQVGHSHGPRQPGHCHWWVKEHL